MERTLGVFETAETLTDQFAPFNVVIVLSMSGCKRSDCLRAALDRLQRRHPLLGTHMVRQGRRFVYRREGTPQIPLELMDSPPEGLWQTVAERELNRRFDIEAGPLMRATLIPSHADEERRDLVLTFHHAIIDGAAAAAVIRELLDAWDGLATGRALPEPATLPMMPPAEQFFPSPFKGLAARRRLATFMVRQMADEMTFRWRARGTRKPVVHETGQCRIVCGDLGGEELAALVRTARRHRVTVHNALNAALLLAVQNQLYGGQAVPLRNFNFASLRRYLSPPVDDEHLGSFHAMLRFTVNLGRGEDFWGLATRINSQVHTAGRRGDKFCSLLTSAGLMRMILRHGGMRMGSTALAYTGPTSIGPIVGGISIEELHAFVSNLVLGPEYTAQARLFRDRLWWDVLYLDSDMNGQTAQEILAEVFQRLHDANRK
jgi:hypothetical protein